MSQHPCVVTINHNSKPRILFSGDQLVEVDLPVGTRVIYPKKPIEPLNDVKASIRYAVNHPENSEPLYAKLRPGMKVTIALRWRIIDVVSFNFNGVSNTKQSQ